MLGHTPLDPPRCGPGDPPARPLNFPLGVGHETPQLDLSASPWVWAWRPPRPDPLTSLLGVGMLGYHPPVDRMTDTCKTLPSQTLFEGGNKEGKEKYIGIQNWQYYQFCVFDKTRILPLASRVWHSWKQRITAAAMIRNPLLTDEILDILVLDAISESSIKILKYSVRPGWPSLIQHNVQIQNVNLRNEAITSSLNKLKDCLI